MIMSWYYLKRRHFNLINCCQKKSNKSDRARHFYWLIFFYKFPLLCFLKNYKCLICCVSLFSIWWLFFFYYFSPLNVTYLKSPSVFFHISSLVIFKMSPTVSSVCVCVSQRVQQDVRCCHFAGKTDYPKGFYRSLLSSYPAPVFAC